MTISRVVALLLLLGAAVQAGDIPLKLVTMQQSFADQYLAKCLDGSPPFRYQLVQDPKKWVIFVEGGGWCTSIGDCAGRAGGGGGSSHGAGPSAVVGGILSADPQNNPRFHNYSLVFLKYCDGTSHTSFQQSPIPVTKEMQAAFNTSVSQIWMRGRAVLVAQFNDLLQSAGLNNAEEVILSGGSAGGLTVYLGLDAVRDILARGAPRAKLVGAPDAGFFLDTLSVSGTYAYRNLFINADVFWNSTKAGNLNPACLAAYPTQPWHCYLAPYAAPFLSTPFFISNSAYDAYQILNELYLGCTPNAAVAGYPKCSDAQMQKFLQYRPAQIAGMQQTLTALPGTGVGQLSCFVHEINVDYCSGQSLPNCIGWNAYNVTAPGYPPQLTPNAIFTMWYDAVLANWDDVVRVRHAAHAALRAASEGKGLPDLSVLQEIAATARGDAAIPHVQVIDPVDFPNNPSCPFPRR